MVSTKVYNSPPLPLVYTNDAISLNWVITNRKSGVSVTIASTKTRIELYADFARRQHQPIATMLKRLEIRCAQPMLIRLVEAEINEPDLYGFSPAFFIQFYDRWATGYCMELAPTLESAWAEFYRSIRRYLASITPQTIAYAWLTDKLSDLDHLPATEQRDADEFDDCIFDDMISLCNRLGIQGFNKQKFIVAFVEGSQEPFLAEHIGYWFAIAGRSLNELPNEILANTDFAQLIATYHAQYQQKVVIRPEVFAEADEIRKYISSQLTANIPIRRNIAGWIQQHGSRTPELKARVQEHIDYWLKEQGKCPSKQ